MGGFLVSLFVLLAAESGGASMQDAIRPGVVVGGACEDGDGIIETKTLAAFYTRAPTVGDFFILSIEESGPYTLELHSYFFDAYLVLWDEDGVFLAEDDDGLYGSHARLVAELEAGRGYRVAVGALHGGRGPYDLNVRFGWPCELSPEEARDVEAVDADECVRVMTSAYGPTHPAVATRLLDLATLLRSKGNHSVARGLCERLLEIGEAARGPDHPETATVLAVLAAVHWSARDLASARPLLERALSIRETTLGSHHELTIASLRDLSRLCRIQRDYAEAQSLAERALAASERRLGPCDQGLSRILTSLANVMLIRGRYAEARPILERAVEVRRTAFGEDRHQYAVGLNELAKYWLARGDYSQARRLWEQALLIQEARLGESHSATSATRRNLARLLATQGDRRKALSLLERSLAIQLGNPRGKDGDVAATLAQIGQVMFREGDYDAALDRFERALVIREATSGPDHWETAAVLNGLGRLQHARGRYDESRQSYERALRIWEAEFGLEHPRVAACREHLAALLHTVGDLSGARHNYERSIAIRRSLFGPDHPAVAQVSHSLARLLMDVGEARSGWELVKPTTAYRPAHLWRTLNAMSEEERHLLLAERRWQLETLLSLGHLSRDHDELSIAAYESLIAWKGQVRRLMTMSRGDLFTDATAEERDLVDDLRSIQRRLSRFASGSEDLDAKSAAHLLALSERAASLERQLGALAGTAELHQRSWSDVRSALPPDSVFLDFFEHRTYRPGRPNPPLGPREGQWSELRLSVWITRADRREPSVIDLGPAELLEEAIDRYLHRLTGDLPHRGRPYRAGSAASDEEELYRSLWEPIESEIGTAPTVFVCPDVFVGRLPFGALRRPDGRYLVEQHVFVYVGDVDALVQRTDRDGEATYGRLLAVGGVDYGLPVQDGPSLGNRIASRSDPVQAPMPSARSQTWERLPGTSEECRAIVEAHTGIFGPGGRRLQLVGGEATEERIKRECPDHDVLHFATHGMAWSERTEGSEIDARHAAFADQQAQAGIRDLQGRRPGLLSALVCAGANASSHSASAFGPGSNRDDGLLTAEEIAWLDLSDAELVVLSACRTALGKPLSGEGLAGLRRSFLVAGARTVVSSLWSVGDRSSTQLMTLFYENLWARELGKAEALTEAKRELIRRNRAYYGSPRPATWAAFVLDGDWR